MHLKSRIPSPQAAAPEPTPEVTPRILPSPRRTGAREESETPFLDGVQLDGPSENERMARLLPSMSLQEQLQHYETGSSMENLLHHASDADLAILTDGGQDASILPLLQERMTPDAYLEARVRLFPDQARDAVRERIQATNGWFIDDKGAAFAAFSTLDIEDRRTLLKQSPDLVDFMGHTDRARFAQLAVSEAEGLGARMTLATQGAGTDDPALAPLVADAGRLLREERALRQRLESGELTPAARASTEQRLLELGEIESLLSPQRDESGHLEEGSFLEQLEGDVKSPELYHYMEDLELGSSEVATQIILDAVGITDDERAIQEAFTRVPVDQRGALYDDPHVQRALLGHLDAEERTVVRAFRDDDGSGMVHARLDQANGFFAQDEAGALRAVMALSAEQRAALEDTTLFLETRGRMDTPERAALDEAMDTGHISMETGVAAAAGGRGDGTNEALLALVSGDKSTQDTEALRRGYVLSRGETANSASDEEALALFQRVESTLARELGHDALQQELDAILTHDTETTRAQERATDGGRLQASRLIHLRALEKMGDDGRGGGGLATHFSDTDETAVQAHQSQMAVHLEAMRDGAVAPAELEQHAALGQTFAEDYQAMLEAQNAVENTLATGATLAAGAALTAATSGLAGPGIAAFMAAHGLEVTTAVLAATRVGTHELAGGDRYDATGTDGVQDAAMSVLVAATGNLASRLGSSVQNGLATRAPGVFVPSTEQLTGVAMREGTGAAIRAQLPGLAAKNLTEAAATAAVETVVDTATTGAFYEQSLGEMLEQLGGELTAAVGVSALDAVLGLSIDTGAATMELRGLAESVRTLEAGGATREELEELSIGTLRELAAAPGLPAYEGPSSSDPTASLDHPEATTGEANAMLQRRVDRLAADRPTDPLAAYLVANRDDPSALKEVLDTHALQFSAEATLHAKTLTGAGVPPAHLDSLGSDSVVALGAVNQVLAEGNVHQARDLLDQVQLSQGSRDLVWAKLLQAHRGAGSLEGRPDLQVLADFADLQSPDFRASDAMLERATSTLGVRWRSKVEQALGRKFPMQASAAEDVATWAGYLRSQMPEGHAAHALGDAELIGQLVYTSTAGPGINQAMRELDPERLSELLPVLQASTSALNGLPRADVPIRRRLKSSLPEEIASQLEVGRTLVDHGFSSASTRPDAPFGDAYVIDIDTSKGADIDAISARGSTLWGTGEAEVLAAPGQRLEILSVVEREGTTWIRARER